MRRIIFFLLAASLLCCAHFGTKDYLQPEAAGVREHGIDVNISQVYYQPDEPVWLYDPDRFNFTVTEDGTNAYDLTGKEIYFAAKKYLGDTSFIFYIPCTVDDATGGLCHADLAVDSLTTAGLYWAGIRITDTTNILVTAWIGKLKALGVISDSPPWAPPQAYTKSESDARYGQKIPGHSNLWQSGFDDFRTSDVRIAEPTETNQPTTMAYVLGEIGALDTDDIPEGASNFYYTEARDTANFTSNLAARTTSDLAEGTNLYWTAVRGTANFETNWSGKDTDDLPEGASNFWWSQSLFDTAFGNKTTSGLAEGTNLYWTLARFSSAFADMTTADLTESNNLYWTQARFDTAFSGKDTDDLDEGTNNLYYTDTRGSNTFETVWAIKTIDDLGQGSSYKKITSGEKDNYDTAYILSTFCPSNAVYVAKNGNDSTGDGSGLNPYLTIQNAQDEATAGDTIVIYDGSYSENVAVSANLNFFCIGEVKVGVATNSVSFTVNSCVVKIDGLSFKGDFDNSGTATLTDCNVGGNFTNYGLHTATLTDSIVGGNFYNPAAVANIDANTIIAGTWSYMEPTLSSKASQVKNVPAGNVAATEVQAAIDELDNEKVAKNPRNVPIPLSYFVESTAGSGTNNSCQVSYEVNANKQVEIRGRSYETNALHTAYCYSVPMTIGEYPLMPNFSSWQTNAFSYIISTDSTNVADNLINIAICYETNQVDLATNLVSTTAGVDLTGDIGTNDVINALGDGDTFWWRVEFQSKNTNDVYLVELKNNYEE